MIAKMLGISESTVKIHLAGVFQQLGVTNRAAAVAIYNDMQNSHLKILRPGGDEPEPAVQSEETNIVALRRKRRKYPPLIDSEGAALPMAAQPESSF